MDDIANRHDFFGFRRDALGGDKHCLAGTGRVEDGELESGEVFERSFGFRDGERVVDLDAPAGEVGN